MQVSTGEYRLSALPVDSEGSSNLLFSPGYIDVNVKCPLLDVEFSQVNEYFFTYSGDFSTLFNFHQVDGYSDLIVSEYYLFVNSHKSMFTVRSSAKRNAIEIFCSCLLD